MALHFVSQMCYLLEIVAPLTLNLYPSPIIFIYPHHITVYLHIHQYINLYFQIIFMNGCFYPAVISIYIYAHILLPIPASTLLIRHSSVVSLSRGSLSSGRSRGWIVYIFKHFEHMDEHGWTKYFREYQMEGSVIFILQKDHIVIQSGYQTNSGVQHRVETGGKNTN